MEQNTELFEKMPVGKALVNLAVPTIISQLIIMIYNLADTYYIGLASDPYKTAASSVSYVLFFVLTALGSLFGVGGGILASRLLGKRQGGEARNVSAFSLWATMGVTACYCLLVLLFLEPLLTLMGASENTMGFAKSYTLITVVTGGIPATLNMTMAHMLRSEGRAKTASFGLGMGGVLNIFLDPLFMFVLLPAGMEVTGAAIATTLCTCIVTVFFMTVYFRHRGDSIISFSPKRLSPGAKYAWEIVSVGVPSALTTILMCAAVLCTNKLASVHYGDIPVAAIGIVKKVEMLPNNVGTGLCQGMIPLVAYNFTARNRERMSNAVRLTRRCGIIFNLFCVALFWVFPQQIAGIFIKNSPETVELTAHCLRIMILATPLAIVNLQTCYTLQAMGKGRESLIVALCRQGMFHMPFLFAMQRLFAFNGLIRAQFAADALTLPVSLPSYRGIKRDFKR